MLPTSKAYLWDAQQACDAALSFVADVDQESFQNSLLLKSAVERQLEILGESFNKIRNSDPELAAQIPDIHRIIAMRNVIAHGYGVVDFAIVWSVVSSRIRPLSIALQELLDSGRS